MKNKRMRDESGAILDCSADLRLLTEGNTDFCNISANV
jgi:hypothetical protein